LCLINCVNVYAILNPSLFRNNVYSEYNYSRTRNDARPITHLASRVFLSCGLNKGYAHARARARDSRNMSLLDAVQTDAHNYYFVLLLLPFSLSRCDLREPVSKSTIEVVAEARDFRVGERGDRANSRERERERERERCRGSGLRTVGGGRDRSGLFSRDTLYTAQRANPSEYQLT